MNFPPTPSNRTIPPSFDVLVVGSGAAGLYATLCLPENLTIGLVTKAKLKKGASDWAQGGIAAAMDPDDSPSLHFEDTIKAGAGICDAEAVRFLVENAPASIHSLLEMGVAFDRHNDKLAMTLEAAHSRHRVLHAADTTGKAIVSTLKAKVLSLSHIQVYQQALALNLWMDTNTGDCCGICLLYDNQIFWVRANAVILATGGGGQVFAKTTNPTVSTGDGVALAWRAGAVLRDLEFFQFHPTALMKSGAPHFLISEAVRGEGAHLVDKDGKRFAFDYHPLGELAPRDVVSRAIFNHLQKNSGLDDRVYLDLRVIPEEKIRYRFPNIIQKCKEWGIDVFKEAIPVAPAAHYWMGGIKVDLLNRTSIRGLYAIGETASTGVHGANRLASNSLLECLVFASQLSKIKIQQHSSGDDSIPECIEFQDNWDKDLDLIHLLREEMPVVMWDCAGICRKKYLLESGIEKISLWRDKLQGLELSKYLSRLSPNHMVKFHASNAEERLRFYAETINLVDIAYLILKSAAFREESRGGHFREDFPNTLSRWEVHTLISGENLSKSE